MKKAAFIVYNIVYTVRALCSEEINNTLYYIYHDVIMLEERKSSLFVFRSTD